MKHVHHCENCGRIISEVEDCKRVGSHAHGHCDNCVKKLGKSKGPQMTQRRLDRASSHARHRENLGGPPNIPR